MVFASHVPVLNAHISTPLPPTACDPNPLLTLIFTFVPPEFDGGVLYPPITVQFPLALPSVYLVLASSTLVPLSTADPE